MKEREAMEARAIKFLDSRCYETDPKLLVEFTEAESALDRSRIIAMIEKAYITYVPEQAFVPTTADATDVYQGYNNGLSAIKFRLEELMAGAAADGGK